MRPEARSVNPETLDCPLIIVAGVGTVAGTNAGVILRNGRPEAPDGNYLVIPFLDREQDKNCRQLFINSVDYESEHNRLLDEPGAWLYYTGPNDWHPIF